MIGEVQGQASKSALQFFVHLVCQDEKARPKI